MVHNYYQERGGEDHSFESEASLLERHGHQVLRHTRHNKDARRINQLRLGLNAVWSEKSRGDLRESILSFKPDLVHFQNTFPLISPSVYSAAKEVGLPVVQTLRNYRLLCLNGLLFRDGRVCEDCVGRSIPWPGVEHACYRNSHAASAVVASMLSFHRLRRTWQREVDVYIANTDFSRLKFIEIGLPEERIVVKPNFVHPDPGSRAGEGRFVLYVGRLSVEKGLRTLLDAWRRLGRGQLKIVGDGPMREEIEAIVRGQGLTEIEVLGYRSPEEVYRVMKQASTVVIPTQSYETFGRVAIEAFACGVPVIASRLGTMKEIVEDGRTGLHFEPGNAEDLAAKVNWAWAHPTEMAELGQQARKDYKEKYTGARNYAMLMEIYEKSIAIAG